MSDMQHEISYYLDTVFPSFEPELKGKLIRESTLKFIPAGAVIMRTGQYFKYTLLIASGKVKLYREGDDGEEAYIYTLGAGNACALSMICNTRQQTSEIMAKAMEDTIAILVPIQLMDSLMQQHKTWYYFVIENYRSRFEELLTVLDSIVFKSMDERLEFYLKNQVRERGSQKLPMTHMEIANDLNTSREVVSRLLKKMEQNKKIQLFRSHMVWLEELK
ncbi:Crp/Fnr family transcriptional regulator [Larkinella bovis]